MHFSGLLICFAAVSLIVSAAPHAHQAVDQPAYTIKRRQLLLSDIQQLYRDGLAASNTAASTAAAQLEASPSTTAAAVFASAESLIPVAAAHRVLKTEAESSLSATTVTQTMPGKLPVILFACSAALFILSLCCMATAYFLYRRYKAQLPASSTDSRSSTSPAVSSRKAPQDALANYKAFWEEKRRSAMSFVSEDAYKTAEGASPGDGRRGSSESHASVRSAGPLPLYSISAPTLVPAVQIDAGGDSRMIPVPNRL